MFTEWRPANPVIKTKTSNRMKKPIFFRTKKKIVKKACPLSHHVFSTTGLSSKDKKEQKSKNANMVLYNDTTREDKHIT